MNTLGKESLFQRIIFVLDCSHELERCFWEFNVSLRFLSNSELLTVEQEDLVKQCAYKIPS